MAMIPLPEIIVNEFSAEDIVSWAEAELRTVKQIALSKEADKAFLLGRITASVGEVASVLEALRKKMKPKSKEEPPVVAG